MSSSPFVSALRDQIRAPGGECAKAEFTVSATVASQAALNGVPLPVVARLLGHSSVRMTLRYAHVGHKEVEAAAERVGTVIASMMDLKCSH